MRRDSCGRGRDFVGTAAVGRGSDLDESVGTETHSRAGPDLVSLRAPGLDHCRRPDGLGPAAVGAKLTLTFKREVL